MLMKQFYVPDARIFAIIWLVLVLIGCCALIVAEQYQHMPTALFSGVTVWFG